MDKLAEAARLIAEVLATLDESDRECGDCHLKVRNNMREYNAAKELRGALKRISAAQGNMAGRVASP